MSLILGTSVDLIRNILISEMSLTDEQIYIYNQKFDIDEVPSLFVVVEYKFGKIYSSRNSQALDNNGNVVESQDVNIQDNLNVMIFSKDLSALQRKEEVIMALNSIYSQQLQEKSNFKIGIVSSIQDTSELEGDAILYRFDIPVVVLTWMSKVKAQTYFNVFPVAVRVNDGQPDLTRSFTQTLTKPN